MERITGLRADIVPHREFAIRRWFYAHPLWYYHRLADEHHLNTDPKFYQLVDPELRALCHLLLDAGLQTTPSCQGHFYPRDRFEHIWEELLREKRRIREGGLEVRDSESDRRYLFLDEAYQLPWQTFDDFFAEANPHQNKGYIGVRIPHERVEILGRLRSEPYAGVCGRIEPDAELSAMFDGDVFNIHVDPPSLLERDGEWQAITDYMRSILRQPVA